MGLKVILNDDEMNELIKKFESNISLFVKSVLDS